MDRTTDYSDNFYFDVSVNEDIDYNHYLKGRTKLSDMAKQAFFSPHWESVANLAPSCLEKQIKLKRSSYSDVCRNYKSTMVLRICIFAATVLHLAGIIACIVALIATGDRTALYILIGLLTLAGLLIPVMNKTGREIAKARAALINEKAVLDYLELADRVLKFTTPIPN